MVNIQIRKQNSHNFLRMECDQDYVRKLRCTVTIMIWVIIIVMVIIIVTHSLKKKITNFDTFIVSITVMV